MLDTIKDMILSKKVIAMLSGVIVATLAKVGLDLDVESVAVIISPIIAYIIGQGWADTGKEAKKEEQRNLNKSTGR